VSDEASMPLVECPKCHWVHFAVSKDYIEEWQDGWNKYWPTLDEEGRAMFGLPDGPPGPEGYYQCFRCGNPDTLSFLPESSMCQKVSLNGHTIQPIYWEKK
jgi:hypothetical protein